MVWLPVLSRYPLSLTLNVHVLLAALHWMALPPTIPVVFVGVPMLALSQLFASVPFVLVSNSYAGVVFVYQPALAPMVWRRVMRTSKLAKRAALVVLLMSSPPLACPA